MKAVRLYPGVRPKKRAKRNAPKRRGSKRRSVKRNVVRVTTALNRPKRRPAKRRSVKRNAVTTMLNKVTTALGTVTTALNRRSVRRNKITTALNRRSTKRVASKRKSRRVASRIRKGGRRKMATAKQRAYLAFFKQHRKAGKSARTIGSMWRSKHGGKKASRNKSGRPLSGSKFRPVLPKGPISAVVSRAKRSWKKAFARSTKPTTKRKSRKKARKAKKNGRITTMFNRGFTSARARSAAMKRWHGKRGSRKGKGRRYRRNFSVGGIIAKFKEALSVKTAKEGLAVLAGAIVATGAPSFLPSWNVGWFGFGLSLFAAAAAAVASTFIAPGFLPSVVAGGVVVVGLRLVRQFAPRALQWSGAQAGFLLPFAGRGSASGVGGFLAPPPGARSVGRLSGLGSSGGQRGLAIAGGEGFRSPKI